MRLIAIILLAVVATTQGLAILEQDNVERDLLTQEADLEQDERDLEDEAEAEQVDEQLFPDTRSFHKIQAKNAKTTGSGKVKYSFWNCHLAKIKKNFWKSLLCKVKPGKNEIYN